MMAEQTGMRYLDLSSYGRPPDELIQMLEAEQAKSLGVIPVYGRSLRNLAHLARSAIL